MSDYRKVTLVERYIDIKSSSVEQLANILKDDFENAIVKHKNLVDEEFENSLENRLNTCREEARKYAELKWKRASRIEQYVEEMCIKESLKTPQYYEYTHGFTFDINFGTTNYVRNIYSDDKIFNVLSLVNILNELKNEHSKFFNNALGWRIYVLCDNNSYCCHFSEFELILPKELENEININKENLAKSINEFYKNVRYWGD